MKIECSDEEQRAINSLKRVAKKWPKTLWLFSASGTLWVMKRGLEGERVKNRDGGVDKDYIIESIDIPNDGGDW